MKEHGVNERCFFDAENDLRRTILAIQNEIEQDDRGRNRVLTVTSILKGSGSNMKHTTNRCFYHLSPLPMEPDARSEN